MLQNNWTPESLEVIALALGKLKDKRALSPLITLLKH